MNDSKPDISIVIPIHNEEGILRTAVDDLLAALPSLGRSFQLVLAENGSADRTIEIATELAETHPEIVTFSVNLPNYGVALRQGIERAVGRYVICDEIDICDIEFYRRAVQILDRGEAHLVIGSKAMPGANDRRPLGRRAATFVINRLLRIMLDFKGTDTHGLKAFHREKLLDVSRACVVDRDLFASEFVIRAGRGDVKVLEIPVDIVEKRPPSIDLARRVPQVLKGLARLFVAVRLGR